MIVTKCKGKKLPSFYLTGLYKVSSDSGTDQEYYVFTTEEVEKKVSLTCNCPDYYFRKQWALEPGKNSCKHMKAVEKFVSRP